MSELEKRYLEEWRKLKRWSQSDLAREAGVNRSIIFKIENSEQVGRYGTAVKIAQALNIEPEQIIDFEPLFGPAKKENRPPLQTINA
jgi:transcriptional regulator with XRE-family HTH domain